MSKELIDELRHEADHWARCATNCTNGIVKAAYTSRSDRIAAAAARIAELEGVVREVEFGSDNNNDECCCPMCGGVAEFHKDRYGGKWGHAPNCRLSAALTPPTKEKP